MPRFRSRPITLLIDADILAYEFAATATKTYTFGDQTVSITEPLAVVEAAAKERIQRWRSELWADRAILCWTHSQNFRKEVLPTYKANRADVPRPVLLEDLRRALMADIESYCYPGLEGDDVLGMLSTGRYLNGTKVIVSTDKDLRQIPGWLYNPDKVWLRRIKPEEGRWWHMMQTLTGDPVDGYSGCPKVGPVRAEKILSQPGDPWTLVVDAYKERGFTEDEALVQARVAYICRSGDYNIRTKKVRLWSPTRKG